MPPGYGLGGMSPDGLAPRHTCDVVEVADASVVVTHHEIGAAVFEHERPGRRTDLVDGVPVEVVHVALFRRERPECLLTGNRLSGIGRRGLCDALLGHG